MNTHESYNSGKTVGIEGNSRNEILEPVEKLSGFVANILENPKNFEATHTSFVTERQKRMGKEPTVRQYSINQEARSKAKEFVNSCKTLSEALNMLESIREQKASLDKNDPHYKQKIAIFRSLLGMAQMQLVDKIKSSLSPQEEEEFVRQINEISEKNKQAKNNSSDRNQTQEMGVHAFVRQKAREIIESKQKSHENPKPVQTGQEESVDQNKYNPEKTTVTEEELYYPLAPQSYPIIERLDPVQALITTNQTIIDASQAPQILKEVNPNLNFWRKLKQRLTSYQVKAGAWLATIAVILSIKGSSAEPPKKVNIPDQRDSISQEIIENSTGTDWLPDFDQGNNQQNTNEQSPVPISGSSNAQRENQAQFGQELEETIPSNLTNSKDLQENSQTLEAEQRLENGMQFGNINLAELASVEIPKEIFDAVNLKPNSESIQGDVIKNDLEILAVTSPSMETGGFPSEMDKKLSEPLKYPNFAVATRTGIKDNNIIWLHSFYDLKGNPFPGEVLRKIWKKYGVEAPLSIDLIINFVDQNGNEQKAKLIAINSFNYKEEVGNQAAIHTNEKGEPVGPPFFRLDGPLGETIPKSENIVTLAFCDGPVNPLTRRVDATERVIAVFEVVK